MQSPLNPPRPRDSHRILVALSLPEETNSPATLSSRSSINEGNSINSPRAIPNMEKRARNGNRGKRKETNGKRKHYRTRGTEEARCAEYGTLSHRHTSCVPRHSRIYMFLVVWSEAPAECFTF